MRQEGSIGCHIGYLVAVLIYLGLKIPFLECVTMGWVEGDGNSLTRKRLSEEKVCKLHLVGS